MLNFENNHVCGGREDAPGAKSEAFLGRQRRLCWSDEHPAVWCSPHHHALSLSTACFVLLRRWTLSYVDVVDLWGGVPLTKTSSLRNWDQYKNLADAITVSYMVHITLLSLLIIILSGTAVLFCFCKNCRVHLRIWSSGDHFDSPANTFILVCNTGKFYKKWMKFINPVVVLPSIMFPVSQGFLLVFSLPCNLLIDIVWQMHQPPLYLNQAFDVSAPNPCWSGHCDYY